jgi:hypothetical protein
VSVHQATELHRYDPYGNHTGPAPLGWIDREIPGSTYATIGDGILATVPAGVTYELQIVPDGGKAFDRRVRDALHLSRGGLVN